MHGDFILSTRLLPCCVFLGAADSVSSFQLCVAGHVALSDNGDRFRRSRNSTKTGTLCLPFMSGDHISAGRRGRIF
ncbi:hypothetical protein B0H11DRAFT_1993557 [Mycena galericulata]|nr:hypothetical protein B0H11DRAFT_1993557 [Mycena galericulata]